MNDMRIRAGLWVLAIAALAPWAMVSFTGDTGAEVTAGILDDAVTLQAGGILATFVAAGLVAAAVVIGRSVPGTAGAVVSAAGVVVSVLYAAYYATFAAAALVGDLMLDEPGAGLGESALLMLNMVELTRFAPTLTLAVAAIIVRRHLPKPVWVAAAVLAAATVVPMTSWIAAILAPVWIAVAAAAVRSPEREPVLV